MSNTETTETAAFVLLCDGSVDQVCGSKREADKEARDLRRMGFDKVKVKRFNTWAEADAFEAKLRGY